jgi:predicted MFS family arabinose efflux permease
MGAEPVILAGGLLFVVANIGLSAVVAFSKFYFLMLTLACQTVNGVATACLCVGEQVILLRYSPKSERESNIGQFRASQAIGMVLAPLLGAIVHPLFGFAGTFFVLALGHAIIQPLVYCKLM